MIQDQREEIKQKLDLVEFINEYVPLKKTGRNFKALCPFHSEDTPSFVVSSERQIWKCFGCNEGGDIFGFLMKIEGVDFGEALQILAKRTGVKLRRYQTSGEEKTKQLLYEINHLASEFYHYLLLNHPAAKEALDYVLGRGINRESLKLFKLGFSPNSWDSLQKYLVGKKNYQATDLEKAGLVIKRSGGYYDRFRNRLMFTLRDQRGNVVGFAGRILDPKKKEAKYVNTPETLVYHKSNLLYGLAETREMIRKADKTVVVEGELDLISSFQVGVKNVVAIKGSAFTDGQIKLISRLTKNLLLALDQDIAGDVAARRGIEVAESMGMMVGVVEIKGGKDPDEVAQKNPSLWRSLVEEAVPIYDYFMDSACSRFDAQSADGKRKIGQEIIPILAKINDEIVRAHYVKQLAGRLGVNEEAVLAQIEKIVKSTEGNNLLRSKQDNRVFPEEIDRNRNPREFLEEYLLALAFQADRWDWLVKKKISRLVKTARFVSLLEKLTQYLKQYKTFRSERLAKMLPAELREIFDRLYLVDFADLLEDQQVLDREGDKIISRLENFELRERLQEINRMIGDLERKKELLPQEEKQLEKLTREFRDFSRQLPEIKPKKE